MKEQRRSGTSLSTRLTRSHRVMKLEAVQSIYNPEVCSALETYNDHLDQVRRRLKARQRVAEQKLHEYEEVGQGMNHIAERYTWILQELEDMRSQITDLENDGLCISL